jgi:hypothetical protein
MAAAGIYFCLPAARPPRAAAGRICEKSVSFCEEKAKSNAISCGIIVLFP